MTKEDQQKLDKFIDQYIQKRESKPTIMKAETVQVNKTTMKKCNCIEPPDLNQNDIIIRLCGRCNGVVGDVDYVPKTFEEAVSPLMNWLAINCHPHTKAIVESNMAELVEGVQSKITDEYLVD